MKRIGLRLKFIALLTLLLLVLFSVLATVLIRQNTGALRTNLNDKSKVFAELATKPIGDTFVLYQNSGRVKITQQAQRFYELDSDVTSVSVIDTEGKVLYSYGTNKRTNVAVPSDGNFESSNKKNSTGVITEIIQPYIEDFGGHRYSLVYGISSTNIKKQVMQITWLILGLGAIILSTSIMLSYVVLNRFFIRPVREVSRLAAVISAGNLDQQIIIKRNDEIGDLAKAVNAMSNALKADITKLQETDKLKTEFMMITSHNLRTPLTIMRGYVEIIRDMKVDDNVRQILSEIESNTIRLSEFAEDVLTISTMEAGDSAIHTEPTKLKPIIDRVVSEFTTVAKGKSLNFKADITLSDELAEISAPHFRSAVWNILDNAYKFTDADDTVHMTVSAKSTGVVIVISDTGTGINAEELPKLFTKFHRGTDTMRYNFEGVGIGLYLTKLIIEEFHGTINVESELGVGSTFTITVPVAASGNDKIAKKNDEVTSGT